VPVTVDAKGRVRASKEQRRVILAEFERRGLSAARFAKLTGLKLLRTFFPSYFCSNWRRKDFGCMAGLALYFVAE
jgi:hypothetical protein